MRKKRHPEHVNHERWLVSYADFITLLFAFFVVMFAVSQVDTKKLGHFTEAFSKAVGINVMPMTGASLLDGNSSTEDKDTQQDESQKGELDELGVALGDIAGSPGGDSLRSMQIIRRGNELILRLPENVFFDTGDARVKGPTVAVLKVIAPKILARRVEVRVEGYTDDRPIVSGRYRSNWELSTGRALAVMTALMAAGIPPERVSIAGYGEYRPIASNATEEGRKQNRRVDLVVTPLRAPESASDASQARAAGSNPAASSNPEANDDSPAGETDDSADASAD